MEIESENVAPTDLHDSQGKKNSIAGMDSIEINAQKPERIMQSDENIEDSIPDNKGSQVCDSKNDVSNEKLLTDPQIVALKEINHNSQKLSENSSQNPNSKRLHSSQKEGQYVDEQRDNQKGNESDDDVIVLESKTSGGGKYNIEHKEIECLKPESQYYHTQDLCKDEFQENANSQVVFQKKSSQKEMREMYSLRDSQEKNSQYDKTGKSNQEKDEDNDEEGDEIIDRMLEEINNSRSNQFEPLSKLISEHNEPDENEKVKDEEIDLDIEIALKESGSEVESKGSSEININDALLNKANNNKILEEEEDDLGYERGLLEKEAVEEKNNAFPQIASINEKEDNSDENNIIEPIAQENQLPVQQSIKAETKISEDVPVEEEIVILLSSQKELVNSSVDTMGEAKNETLEDQAENNEGLNTKPDSKTPEKSLPAIENESLKQLCYLPPQEVKLLEQDSAETDNRTSNEDGLNKFTGDDEEPRGEYSNVKDEGQKAKQSLNERKVLNTKCSLQPEADAPNLYKEGDHTETKSTEIIPNERILNLEEANSTPAFNEEKNNNQHENNSVIEMNDTSSNEEAVKVGAINATNALHDEKVAHSGLIAGEAIQQGSQNNDKETDAENFGTKVLEIKEPEIFPNSNDNPKNCQSIFRTQEESSEEAIINTVQNSSFIKLENSQKAELNEHVIKEDEGIMPTGQLNMHLNGEELILPSADKIEIEPITNHIVSNLSQLDEAIVKPNVEINEIKAQLSSNDCENVACLEVSPIAFGSNTQEILNAPQTINATGFPLNDSVKRASCDMTKEGGGEKGLSINGEESLKYGLKYDSNIEKGKDSNVGEVKELSINGGGKDFNNQEETEHTFEEKKVCAKDLALKSEPNIHQEGNSSMDIEPDTTFSKMENATTKPEVNKEEGAKAANDNASTTTSFKSAFDPSPSKSLTKEPSYDPETMQKIMGLIDSATKPMCLSDLKALCLQNNLTLTEECLRDHVKMLALQRECNVISFALEDNKLLRLDYALHENKGTKEQALSAEELAKREEDELTARLKKLNEYVQKLREKKYKLEAMVKSNPRIKKLHHYNELKDACQSVLGKLADFDKRTFAEVHEDFGLSLED